MPHLVPLPHEIKEPMPLVFVLLWIANFFFLTYALDCAIDHMRIPLAPRKNTKRKA